MSEGGSNGQRNCRSQGKFTERRIDQAQGAIGQMKSNDGWSLEDRQSLFGRSHVVTAGGFGSDGFRRAPLLATGGGCRSWRPAAKGGVDSQRRSIKDWPDRVVVLARMTLAHSWPKLANLALIMALSKVCPCLALGCS